MLLQDYFADQLHQLRLFFDEPESDAKLLAVDETLIPIVERTLVKLDGLEDNPHVLHPSTVPFSDPAEYAGAVLADLVAENEVFRDDFASAGITLPHPKDADPVTRLGDYVQRLSDCWPPSEGNYILVLHPESVADGVSFLEFAQAVAKLTTPPIVKWIFFVDSVVIPSDFPADHSVLPLQRWEASNQEVQQDVADQLDNPQIPPAERLKLTSMAAGFAAGEGDLESSELLHRQTIELARQQKDVPGEATAHYHVGNALMAQQQFEIAEGHLSQCVILSVECEMHSLVGMAMTHLGVCLDQLDRRDESADAFDAAASTFDGIGDVPAHARVFDVRALQAITKDEVPVAQAHWQKSLALFESIQPGPLDPVRDSGIEEIQEKLNQHCGGQTSNSSNPENL